MRTAPLVSEDEIPAEMKYGIMISQAWWHMPLIPALGRQRQEDHEF
jgi:flagellar biosynthesis protein FliR